MYTAQNTLAILSAITYFTLQVTHCDLSNAAQHNVLLIVSDDQRPDTIRALGNDTIKTPYLDSLVRDGSVFTRAICANPICTPSRGELLSGCSGFRTGVLDFGGNRPSGFTYFADAMVAEGYETFYVGKWHSKGRPSEYGYQRTAALFGSGGKKWQKPNQVDAHGRPVTGYSGWVFQSNSGKEKFPNLGIGLTGDISEKFADASIEFIKRPHHKPFFLHCNFTAPHDPLIVPPGFENAYDPTDIELPKNFAPRHPFDHGNMNSRDENLLPLPRTVIETQRDLAVYYAVISHMDQQVGRILSALDEAGVRDETIIIFTSDHGLAMGSHGLRGKQNMYEHTINVPMLISGPGVPKQKSFDAQMYLRDLYPTVCDLTGIPIPDVDGRSLGQVLRGERDAIYDHVFGYFRNFQRMVRSDRWKLIHYPQINKWQLFDLVSDKNEIHDLSDAPEFFAKKRELQSKLRIWQKEVEDPILKATNRSNLKSNVD